MASDVLLPPQQKKEWSISILHEIFPHYRQVSIALEQFISEFTLTTLAQREDKKQPPPQRVPTLHEQSSREEMNICILAVGHRDIETNVLQDTLTPK